jgi:hypothetical protein
MRFRVGSGVSLGYANVRSYPFDDSFPVIWRQNKKQRRGVA